MRRGLRKTTTNILVIPDSHVESDTNLKRFEEVSKLIRTIQPDYVVQIGDFCTFDSLSSHNKNKKLTLEGQRYNEELSLIMEAYRLLMSRKRKWRKKPKLVWIEGNHEDRILRYAEEHPELDGFIDYKNYINLTRDGWELIPYRGIKWISNIAFTHVPMNPINTPIGGKYCVKRAVELLGHSVVFGHTHRLEMASVGYVGPDGNRIARGLSVGCFFNGIPDYAKGSQGSRDWWRGLVLIHAFEDGDFDITTIKLQELL